MKVLVSCVPGFGHFHPLVPLAQALVDAGHQVAVATAERFCRRVVEPAGLPAFPAGVSPILASERTNELADAAGFTEDDVWRFGAHLFAEAYAPPKVPDLVGIVRDWGADLLLHDATDFAGPPAAATCGIPSANHGFGVLQPDEFWDLAGELVAPTWAAWGVDPGPLGGMFRSLYLDACPASLQSSMIERIPRPRPQRPAAFDRHPEGAGPPPWLATLAAAPTVYVTLGTVANHTQGVFEAVLDGLADLPANLIVTVGPDRDPADLGPQPPHVHVERYLSQSLVFPSCDLVVCHGGSGTTMAALASGIPLLLLPLEANQRWNAAAIVARGAGALLRPADLTPEAVRKAVEGLLDSPTHRASAGRLAGEIADLPGPEQAVPALVELAAG